MHTNIVKSTNKNLLYLGYITPLVFWGTTIICGTITDNYSHLINMVSELGALGSQTQYIFTIGLVLSSILSVLFMVGLLGIAKEKNLSTLPIWLILTFSFSIAGAAVFPYPTELHGILGIPSVFLPLSPLIAIMVWPGNRIQGIKLMSALILIIMLMGFLVFFPSIMDNYFGLKQRFFHIGWSLWFIYLSHITIKLTRINK